MTARVDASGGDNYAFGGVGSGQHLAGELLKSYDASPRKRCACAVAIRRQRARATARPRRETV
jgi:hypothetical protein